MWRRFAKRRALAKTISWRGMSFVVTTSAVWAISGRLTLAASVGVLEVLLKSAGYYVHECLWECVDLRQVSKLPFHAWVRGRLGWLTQEHHAIQQEEAIR
jgi:uncharacterized membrane protein